MSGSGTCKLGDVLDGLDQRDRAFGDLAERADHFGMAGMADEQDVAAVVDQPLGLAVDLRHQRAGRIDDSRGPRSLGRGGHRLGHAMGREHDRPVVRNLVELVDEDRAQIAQPVDDEAVVDDLMPDIDGRAEALERQLDDLDRAVDAGAETARGGNQDVEGADGSAIRAGHVRHRLQA